MNRKISAVIAAVTLMTTLSGCGWSGAAGPGPVNVGAQAPAPSSDGPVRSPSAMNDRGNILKKVGEPGGLGKPGQALAEWVVTKISVDPTCTVSVGDKPKNGHFVFVNMKVSTSAEIGVNGAPPLDLTGAAWKFIGVDGKTFDGDLVGNGGSCLPASQLLPASIGPTATHEGIVVLDVPATAGSLFLAMGGTQGWEWELPK